MACSGIFYCFYFLLLSRERFLLFKRFYLLGSLAASFLLPLISIEVAKKSSNKIVTEWYPYQYLESKPTGTTISNYINWGLYTILIFISLFLLVRFVQNLLKIWHTQRHSQILIVHNIKFALLNNEITPHSFWDTIFLNKSSFEKGEIEDEIIAHECAHVRQLHSLDILFVELLKVIVWFNPFIYLYNQSIRINHEYLADAAVIKQYNDISKYQHILLHNIEALQKTSFSSQFNFFTTKKRLLMLNKHFAGNRLFMALLLLLPVIIIAVMVGCKQEEKTAPVTLTEEPINPESANSGSVTSDSLKLNSVTFTENRDTNREIERSNAKENANMPPPPPPPKVRFTPPKIIKAQPEGPGISEDDLKEYDNIVKEMRVSENKYKYIEDKTERAFFLYELMTYDQRSRALQLPPPPPPASKNKVRFTPPKIVKDSVVQK